MRTAPNWALAVIEILGNVHQRVTAIAQPNQHKKNSKRHTTAVCTTRTRQRVGVVVDQEK
jgi:hypothetical protein